MCLNYNCTLAVYKALFENSKEIMDWNMTAYDMNCTEKNLKKKKTVWPCSNGQCEKSCEIKGAAKKWL